MKVKLNKDLEKVKGVCLHHKRHWIAVGIADGIIQIWDYQSGQLIHQYVRHCGPVRGLDYHPTHNLLATGSDDTRIKVWKDVCVSQSGSSRCLFTLNGHQDYVRVVSFHSTYPWLVSASDDYSIRIWNWQNRQFLTSMMGHTNWVSTINIHPTMDLLVSSSLDGSVRLWDFSGLRQRTCSLKPEHVGVEHIWGSLDIVTDYVWEGFLGEVGLAVFHPTKPLLCIGEGRQLHFYDIKTKREIESLELDRVTGRQELGIKDGLFLNGCQQVMDSLITLSGSYRVIRAWDYKSGVVKGVSKTDTKHLGLSKSSRGYLASVTSKGFTVFKIWRERPPIITYMHHLYYIQGGVLRHFNTQRSKDIALVTLAGLKESEVVSLSYNQSEHAILLNSTIKEKHHSYQLFCLVEGAVNMKPKIKKSPGQCAVWSQHNRFAVLEKNNLIIKDMKNQNVNFAGFVSGFLLPKSTSSTTAPKMPTCDKIFQGGLPGQLLLQEGDVVMIYDTVKKRRLTSQSFKCLKSVVWSRDNTLVAILCRNEIWLCDARLKPLSQSPHKFRTKVKSAVWCNHTGALLLTTEQQLCYILPYTGYEGTVTSLKNVFYLGVVDSVGGKVFGFYRGQPNVITMDINSSEYMFKSSVLAGREEETAVLVRSGKLIGQSLLLFLREVGQPGMALNFIRDPNTRFWLALEANDLDAASLSVSQLPPETSTTCWTSLAERALLNGNITLAESAYYKARNYQSLQLIYTITGQWTKLAKLSKVMEIQGNYSAVYAINLLLGKVKERAVLLDRAGQKSLANLTLEVHHLREKDSLSHKDYNGFYSSCPTPTFFSAPPAIDNSGYNWPQQNSSSKGVDNKEIVTEQYRDQTKSVINNIAPSSMN